MLKPVIQNEPFCAIFRQGNAILVTVFAYAKLSPAVEPLAQQSDLVGRGLSGAALTEAPITPRQNGGTMPFRRQPLGNPEHHRRFTCAADGQVANTDYGTLKPPAAQEPAPVKGRSQPHHSTIKQAQGPQQHSSNRGPRHVCARCGSIIAARRSSVAAVAPRLRSTISRAAKPICARRSAFSSRPAHAMPSCAAEST